LKVALERDRVFRTAANNVDRLGGIVVSSIALQDKLFPTAALRQRSHQFRQVRHWGSPVPTPPCDGYGGSRERLGSSGPRNLPTSGQQRRRVERADCHGLQHRVLVPDAL
jgi:hypothetical protein